MTLYRLYIKRTFDIILSGLAIILLSPLFLIISLLVKFKLGSPIFFKQPRPGKNEKIFYLYKFRSMTNTTDEDGKLLPDNKRLTKFGKFLRKSSIDELPELYNILKGDMSIVGPRPQTIYNLQYYNTDERKRQTVRPGLTGLAQIRGRNNLKWENRFKLDNDYINNITILTDAKIIYETIAKVFKGSDVEVRDNNILKNFTSYKIVNEEKDIHEDNMATYSEIGSYFWLSSDEIKNLNNNCKYELKEWLPPTSDFTLTYSGRNAIHLALKDILSKKKIQKAYIPSYCCLSMLQPFIELNIDYEFYEIVLEGKDFKYEFPENLKDNSIILLMSYFGADISKVNLSIKKLKEKNTTIIEDITHSLLSTNGYSKNSDYWVASLRKWFPIPTGGWLGKKEGNLMTKPNHSSDHAVEEKIEGMIEKFSYISGIIKDKKSFLIKNAKFDGELAKAKDYLEIDSLSLMIIKNLPINKIIKKRKDNGFILTEGLKNLNIKSIELLDINYKDITPLFIPIFLSKNYRDSLRQFLINKGVYCPVHWPEVMGANPGVRENELSLICDQRYNENDMHYIIDCIQEWNSLVKSK